MNQSVLSGFVGFVIVFAVCIKCLGLNMNHDGITMNDDAFKCNGRCHVR